MHSRKLIPGEAAGDLKQIKPKGHDAACPRDTPSFDANLSYHALQGTNCEIYHPEGTYGKKHF